MQTASSQRASPLPRPPPARAGSPGFIVVVRVCVHVCSESTVVLRHDVFIALREVHAACSAAVALNIRNILLLQYAAFLFVRF